MKKRIQQILSLLCVLALVLGCTAVFAVAEDPATQYDSRIITVEWKDDNNYDGLRTSLTATLGGQSVTLNEGNGWTGEVSVPASTSNDGWTVSGIPNGYSTNYSYGSITRLTLSHSVASLIPITAEVKWLGDDNDNTGTRPESVQLVLKADGEPCGTMKEAKAPSWKVTWKDLRAYKPNSNTEIDYEVEQLTTPAGYTSSTSGLIVTNTLQTGTLALSATVTGVPEDADVSSLHLVIDGPDPSMPQHLTYGQLSGGTATFSPVLPGAYLVYETNADSLVEGYTMDTANSKVVDAVYVTPGGTKTLEFKYAYRLPEAIEVDENYDPMANIGSLQFKILGPDPRTPFTMSYADFTDGPNGKEYNLPDLVPGVYTVVETNAEGLIKYYTLTSFSTAGLAIQVEPDGTATAKLFNQYVPAPTPEPEAEFVDVPVTKTWNDKDNIDGNRPESITVRLYADGVEKDSHVLTAAENWSYTFMDLPRYKEDNKTEIVYTVGEDTVAMYAATINGYNIVNDYKPEETSVSVAKVWRDDNDKRKIRPTSIAMTLSDGQKTVTTVVLNEENGWTATVSHLPTVVNGKPAKYSWKEQEVLEYTLESVQQRGNTMIFTNAIWKRPDNPPKGKPPKTPGETWYVFEEYDTPLGVEIVINHVGDCFD